MKLKTYIIPDFRTIEVRGGVYCGGELSPTYREDPETVDPTDPDPKPGVEGFDAPIFRPGIWDEE